jgi:hypothetical protein
MLLGALCAVAGLLCAYFGLSRAPRHLRLPLRVFVWFYVLTTATGATLLSVPLVRELWAFTYPNMDTRWLAPAESWGYWFMVWAPLIVTTFASVWFYPRLRAPVVVVARLLEQRIDVLPATLVAAFMCGYCFVNLGVNGYLGVSPLSSAIVGIYRLTITLRHEMFSVLGTLHFACIYMGIPAVAIVALCNAARGRGYAWALLFIALSLALTILYAATLTKSLILIYGIEVVVAAQVLGMIRVRGLIVSVLLGALLLSVLTTLLGGNELDFAVTAYNILFREASNVPFYLAIFPQQIPYVGIDVGLGGFGIGPTVPTNQIVSNFMFPHDTWIQGAAPAAAHVMAYAQGGYLWSFVTMILVGVWIGVSGQLKRVARNPLVFSAFIGSVTTCYYLSQSDLVGAFNVAYGYRWWLAGLLLLIAAQRALQLALPRQLGALQESEGMNTHDNAVG